MGPTLEVGLARKVLEHLYGQLNVGALRSARTRCERRCAWCPSSPDVDLQDVTEDVLAGVGEVAGGSPRRTWPSATTST